MPSTASPPPSTRLPKRIKIIEDRKNLGIQFVAAFRPKETTSTVAERAAWSSNRLSCLPYELRLQIHNDVFAESVIINLNAPIIKRPVPPFLHLDPAFQDPRTPRPQYHFSPVAGAFNPETTTFRMTLEMKQSIRKGLISVIPGYTVLPLEDHQSLDMVIYCKTLYPASIIGGSTIFGPRGSKIAKTNESRYHHLRLSLQNEHLMLWSKLFKDLTDNHQNFVRTMEFHVKTRTETVRNLYTVVSWPGLRTLRVFFERYCFTSEEVMFLREGLEGRRRTYGFGALELDVRQVDFADPIGGRAEFDGGELLREIVMM